MSNTYRTIHAAITEGFWCYEDGPPVMTGELREQVGQIVAAACEKIEPAPQIIRTPAELEALDGEAIVGSKGGYITSATELRLFVRPHNADRHLPAVVLRDGAGVRACWEALEGETT